MTIIKVNNIVTIIMAGIYSYQQILYNYAKQEVMVMMKLEKVVNAEFVGFKK